MFAVVYGLWIWLPWLAPVMMQAGWDTAGRLIYAAYSFFCHQLPERSIFLFGPDPMYSLAEIQAVWGSTVNPMILRKFIGSDAMGWKVAWSDRMVSFYGGVWLLALAWWPLRRRIRPLPWWGLAALLLPMAVDGMTHAVSDLSGLGLGFRDTNRWLVSFAGSSLPIVYAGDALGSFNSWARLITGVLASLGVVWFAVPHVERSFAEN